MEMLSWLRSMKSQKIVEVVKFIQRGAETSDRQNLTSRCWDVSARYFRQVVDGHIEYLYRIYKKN